MTSSDGNNPNTTIVVISDDGRIFKLEKNYWAKGEELTDAEAQFLPSQVKASGGFVAFPNPIAVGIGVECVIVNLDAILKSQLGSTSPPAPPTASAQTDPGASAPHAAKGYR
jgi:hypothetical protein